MSVDPSGLVRIGRGQVEISRIGLGTAAFGGLYDHVEAREATAVVVRAVEAGITYADTAPLYGHGSAERRLGAALANLPSGQPRLSLSTKVGRVLVENPGADPDIFADAEPAEAVFDFSPDGIRRSLESSLERLGRDRVDIVYLHDPDDHADQAINVSYPVLHQMRAEGIVGAIGIGMNQVSVPARFVRETDLDVILVAGRHTLLDRSAEDELLPLCRANRVSVVVGGVFNSGLLADPHEGAMFDYAPVTPEVLSRARRLRDVCASFDVPLKAAALQFPFREPAVASVLLGCRSVAELDENLELLSINIPDELWEAV